MQPEKHNCMQQMKYVARYLAKGRGSSLIRIVSLTLGLVVGLVLYTQVAFEMSYDDFHPDKDRIYRIQRVSLAENGRSAEDALLYTPFPKAMMSDVKGVESASLAASTTEEATLLVGDKKHTEKMLNVDEHFFDVFQWTVLSGNPANLSLPYQAFISRSAAERLFGRKDPVGETILYNQFDYKKTPLTVAGVFEDIPKNSSFDLDVLLSIQTVFTEWNRQPGWLENDNYMGYVKLQPGILPEAVDAQIPDMLGRYMDKKELETKGHNYTFYLKAFTSLHTTDPAVRRLLLILALLASSLLLVSAMNYVLISVSSLVKRSRLIGVYKTCGASDRDVFLQFICETAILLFVSLLLAVLLIGLFRGQIEELIHTPVAALFSMRNLWVTFVVVALLLIVAGVVPAQLFSKVSAAQAFRSAAVNKRLWKNVLLFIQFTSVACVCILLSVIVRQYGMMVDKDPGYTVGNVLFAKLNGVPYDRVYLIKSEFERLPSVVKASVSTDLPIYGMCGDGISDPETGKGLFSYKAMAADCDFLETLQIQMLSGTNFEREGNNPRHVLVNEMFVEKMQMAGFPTDGMLKNNLDGEVWIAGVVKDFQLLNLYRETEPVMICPVDPARSVWWGTKNYLTLRLTELTPQLYAELSSKLLALTGNNCLEFKSYKQVWADEYTEARLFRNAVVVASAIMLVITMLGLFGYMEDEIVRRRKEIAIRKINGASAVDVLSVVGKDFMYVALPSIATGALLSYAFGIRWLQQFAVKIPLTFTLFAASSLALLVLLLAGVCIRCWRIANENPTSSMLGAGQSVALTRA